MHQDQPATAPAANAKACSRSKLQKKLPAPCTNTQMRGLSGASRHSRQPTAPERDDRNPILRFYFRPSWRRSGEDQEHGKSARICSSNISNISSIYKQRLQLHQRVQQRLLATALAYPGACFCVPHCLQQCASGNSSAAARGSSSSNKWQQKHAVATAAAAVAAAAIIFKLSPATSWDGPRPLLGQTWLMKSARRVSGVQNVAIEFHIAQIWLY